MKLDDETREKLDKLPIGLRTIANYLLGAFDNLINGNCNEETVQSTLITLNENVSGRVGKEDVLNYTKTSEILGFGRNLVGMKQLLDKNKIEQVVINNQRCGFLRSDIMALKNKINNEYRKKEMIAKRKAEREAAKLRQKEEYEQELRRIRAEVQARRFK